MKVAMYYNNNDIRLEEMPKPEIAKDEVLFKVKACGICGSDVMEWYRVKKAPRVLGHEATGEIVEVGAEVSNYKVGDRVFVSHHVPCTKCRYCVRGHHTACKTLHSTNFFPGGFAEFVRVPKLNVESGIYILPENVSFEEGTFIEPLGCVLRGQRLLGIEEDDTVLVLGSGVSGLLHIQLAKMQNARVIATDINSYRLKAAKKFGADSVIDAKENVPLKVLELNENRLADKVIVCTGAMPAMNQSLHVVEKGGKIQFFAPTPEGVNLPIPVNEFWRNEVTMMTSYGAAPNDLKEALNLVKEKKLKLNEMITHKLSLEQAALGFKLVAEAKECIKVIIRP